MLLIAWRKCLGRAASDADWRSKHLGIMEDTGGLQLGNVLQWRRSVTHSIEWPMAA